MKRTLSTIGIIAALTLLAVFNGRGPAIAATTILVGDPFLTSDGSFPYVCGDVLNPCDTIQHGVDTASAGDTLDIAAGPYNENVVIDKRLILDGAGSSGIGTVVSSVAANTPVITIDGNVAGGASASDRMVLKDLRVQGATGGSGAINSGVRISGSGTTEYLTFDNVSAINNAGSGIAFDHTGSVGDVVVTGSDLSNNGNAGLRIPTSVALFDGLSVLGGTIDNNAINGIQTGPSGSPNVTNVTIDGTSFTGNGTATSGGDGDISLFKFNGNATIKDVTIAADSHIGLQIRGNDPVVTPSGSVTLDNVQITGNPRYGMSIIGFSDVSGMSFTDVDIQTTGNWALYLENLGTTLDIGNAVLGPAIVASIGNVSAGAVDATGATFVGAANNFVIEDRVLHGIDAPGGGIVTWVANNVYVSVNSFAPPLTLTPSIQRGINASPAGGIVNVQAGTWNEPLTVSTAGLQLRGAQFGIDPRPTCTAASETVQRRSISVSGNDVIVDGFTVAEVGSDGIAPGPVGPANPDTLGTGIYLSPSASGYRVQNNIIRDNIFGVYFNANGVNPSTVRTNCFIRNNEPGAAAGNGIYSDQGLSNGTADSNKFTDQASAAMVFAGTQSGLTITNNEMLNDSSIVLFQTTGATISGNTTTNPNGSAFYLGGGNTNIDVLNNSVTASPFTAVRITQDFGGPNSDIEVGGNTLSGTGAATAYGVRATTNGISTGLNVHNNTTAGHFRGIDVSGATGPIISDNDVSGFSGACTGADLCSMGIRVLDSTSIDVSLNEVDGGNTGSCVGGFWGIYASNSGGSIDDNEISGIGNGLTTGCQEGRALEVKGAGTMSITNNAIGTYQKSGIIVRDTVNSTIDGNTTTGVGPTAAIAMNGITVTSTGTTIINDNVTNGHRYTPEPTFSCGILYFPVGNPAPGALQVTLNSSTTDEVGICLTKGSATSVSGVSVTGNSVVNHRQRGIDVDGMTGVLVDNNTIDGQGGGTTGNPGTNPDTDTRYYGIMVTDSTGTISNNDITDITHGPANGTQSGVGIRVSARSGASTDVDITDNVVLLSQKNGMAILNPYGGTSVHADIDGNTVTGNGPINYIAQNGIQVSNGATATVTDNNISGYDYTPATFAAIGILIAQAGNVTVDGNNVHDNMEGMYVQQTNGAIVTDNTFTANRDASIFTYLSSNGLYTGNQIFGQPNSVGLYLYDASNNNAFTGNAFRNHEYGVIVDYTAGGPTGSNFDSNCIAGNITAGMATAGTQVGGPVDAENNWWGKVNGPNPPGNGDVLDTAATIDALPFLVAPVAGCPVPADGDGDGVNDPLDNCPTVYNAGQENTNGEPMLLPKPVPFYNDATNPAGDNVGDACDPDIDGDGVPNDDEIAMGLSPYVWDTDGDRTNDGTEIACGSNPLQSTSNLSGADTDNDKLPNLCEIIYGSNPADIDSDDDGVLDGTEVKYWMSNPLSTNTDADDCTDAREVASVTGDRVVNIVDLQQVAAHFGSLPPAFRPFDYTGDGFLNIIDLQQIAARIGPCTPV